MSNFDKKYILGTAIKITTVLNIAEATSAKISICDSVGTVKIDGVDMTQDVDNIYSYIYQSDADDRDGKYIAKIEVTYAGYTAIAEDCFTLIESECD